MKASDSKFLDSSVWLAYLLQADERVKAFIDNDAIILTSVISLFEVKRKLLKDKIENTKVEHAIEFMKKRSILIALTAEICEEAAKQTLPAIDALIYTTARKNKAELITYDNDFRGLEEVTVL